MMKQITPVSLIFLFVLSSCPTSKEVASSSILQKRKYRSGWYVNLPGHPDRSSATAKHAPRTASLRPEYLQPVRPLTYEPEAALPSIPSAVAMVRSTPELVHDRLLPASVSTKDKRKNAKLKWVAANKPQQLENKANLSDPASFTPVLAPAPLLAAAPDGGSSMNTLAVVGFILAFFFPLLGLIFSIIALGQIKRNGGRGHGLAMAGLIISLVTMLILIAVLA